MFLTMIFVGMFLVAAGDASAQDCKPGPNQIALFADINYQGKCVVLDAGELYNVEDVGFTNDTLSSVMFGSNISTVILYEDINLKGKKLTFAKNVATLENTFVGNDTVSSIIIRLKK